MNKPFTIDVIERRRQWADALRSGEFEQIKHYLRDDDQTLTDKPGMCCLGVACHLADPSKWQGSSYPDAFMNYSEGLPGENVADAFGIRALNREFHWYPPMFPDFYAQLNDELDFTFAMIADVVETQIP